MRKIGVIVFAFCVLAFVATHVAQATGPPVATLNDSMMVAPTAACEPQMANALIPTLSVNAIQNVDQATFAAIGTVESVRSANKFDMNTVNRGAFTGDKIDAWNSAARVDNLYTTS